MKLTVRTSVLKLLSKYVILEASKRNPCNSLRFDFGRKYLLGRTVFTYFYPISFNTFLVCRSCLEFQHNEIPILNEMPQVFSGGGKSKKTLSTTYFKKYKYLSR